MTAPVRVVVAGGSPEHRRALGRALGADGTIVVAGEAASAAEAARVVARTGPDVVTMELGPPGERDGIPAAIEAIAASAIPILVLSAPGAERDTAAIEALAAGAVDCLPVAPEWPEAAAAALRRRVLVLSRVQMVRRAQASRRHDRTPSRGGPVVALAASTGGPSALRTVLGALGGLPAPVLLVQHIHPDFAEPFVAWLAEATGLPVSLATDGERARPGHVHVAPPGVHLRLGSARVLRLDPEPERISRPSCDELLASVAAQAGPQGIGAVLTGMGDDGARGLLALRERGGTTFAQDGESATVDGMPRAARERGGVQRSLPLDALGPALAEAARRVVAG